MAEVPAGSNPVRNGARPVVLLWFLLNVVAQLPYVQAAIAPPRGHGFLGYFFFVDDRYNYLSFVQQAEDGAFPFRNKLVLAPHAGRLVNLEWWLVGRLSALLGHHPFLAYHLFGLGASLLLVFAVDLWLRRAGLPESHRLPGLALVCLGGGLGGAAYLTGALPLSDCLDMRSGLYPFIEILANPHFVIGTALLLTTLAAWIEGRIAAAVLLGTVLGLTRPYDLVLVVLIRTLGVVLTSPPRRIPSLLLPLAAYAPVVAYCYWIFYRDPSFAFYANAPYLFPPPIQWLVALGPAALLALTALRRKSVEPWSVHLAVWAGIAGIIVAARPVHFSLQFLVGIGIPLLSLGVLGLARYPPVITLVVTGALGLSSVAAVQLVHGSGPARWYVPSEWLALVEALRPHCRPGDLAFLPGELGLYAAGRTACHAYSSHAIEPDHESRAQAIVRFYTGASPGERARVLDTTCARFVAAPVSGGEAFLTRGPLEVAAVTATLAIYRWDPGPSCPSPEQVR